MILSPDLENYWNFLSKKMKIIYDFFFSKIILNKLGDFIINSKQIYPRTFGFCRFFYVIILLRRYVKMKFSIQLQGRGWKWNFVVSRGKNALDDIFVHRKIDFSFGDLESWKNTLQSPLVLVKIRKKISRLMTFHL